MSARNSLTDTRRQRAWKTRNCKVAQLYFQRTKDVFVVDDVQTPWLYFMQNTIVCRRHQRKGSRKREKCAFLYMIHWKLWSARQLVQ